MTMLEQIAYALFLAQRGGYSEEHTALMWRVHRDSYLAQAEAALEALRQPTPEMQAILGPEASANWQRLSDAAHGTGMQEAA